MKSPLCAVVMAWLACFTSANVQALTENPSQNLYFWHNIKCGDFLQMNTTKLPEAKFEQCQLVKGGQINYLEATYRVEGKNAKLVENYLQKYTDLSLLEFICCGWSVRKGTMQLKGKQGENYEVDFASEETLYSQRADWHKINYFYITVKFYLGEP